MSYLKSLETLATSARKRLDDNEPPIQLDAKHLLVLDNALASLKVIDEVLALLKRKRG